MNIVEQIHYEFYNSPESVVSFPKVNTELDYDLIEKVSDLGFPNASNIRINYNRKKEIDKAKEKQLFVDDMKSKFPMYRMISASDVKRICDKYSLVKGLSREFIGNIPDKNMEDIVRFTELFFSYDNVGVINPFSVCATADQFDKSIHSNFIDPIVLYPIDGLGGQYVNFYFIVTAWGVESNDSGVVNYLNN